MTVVDRDSVFEGTVPAIYDAYLVPLIFQPYAGDLAVRVSAIGASKILELACGTGVVTRALAAMLPESSQIVATDWNQPMLDYGSAKGTVRPVEWRRADAMNLPFENDSFDAVVCQFAVMFFPDKPKAMSEARRVLRSGGTYVFNVWDRIAENEFAETVTMALAAVFPDDPPRFMARTPHGYHDTSVIRRDMEAAGFGDFTLETIASRSVADSPRGPAVAYCQGTPLRDEIFARDPSRVGEATNAAEKLVAARFGTGAVDAKIQAHIIVAQKS